MPATTSKPKRLVRSRRPGDRLPPNTVCVTRPGKFGNPFRVLDRRLGIPGVTTAAEAVAEYERWLKYHSRGREIARLAKTELRGKNLAYWCGIGKPCHADVLLKIANPAEHF